jgi:uncharacterized protein involved in response to NO
VAWLHQFNGDIALPTHFAPLDWHVHEMLFGYVAAAIAGFLLMAIPNWTGRLPNGWPIAGLATLWLAGRAAILFSAKIGSALAAAIDIAFLLTLAALTAREIVGNNWRNLRVLGVLGALALGNIVFHVEVLIKGGANYGTRMGLAVVIRVVPSFTNNWLARNNPGRLPAPFSRYDMIAIAESSKSPRRQVSAISAPSGVNHTKPNSFQCVIDLEGLAPVTHPQGQTPPTLPLLQPGPPTSSVPTIPIPAVPTIPIPAAPPSRPVTNDTNI